MSAGRRGRRAGGNAPSGADPSGADPSGADPSGPDPVGNGPVAASPVGSRPDGGSPFGRVLARLARGARRAGFQTIAVVAALIAIAAVLTVRHNSSADPGIGTVVRVGVAQGASIPAYLDDSRARLAAMPAGRDGYALVSLSGYLAPGQLVPVLAGVEVFQVYARVPLPDVQTAIVKLPVDRVPDDVIAGMDAQAGERAREAARTGDQVAAEEAAGYRRHCACVYAAVVRAPAGTLRQLAGRAQVRGVDPAPQVTDLGDAVFLPPLPEQKDTARPPVDDAPLPSGSPTVH